MLYFHFRLTSDAIVSWPINKPLEKAYAKATFSVFPLSNVLSRNNNICKSKNICSLPNMMTKSVVNSSLNLEIFFSHICNLLQLRAEKLDLRIRFWSHIETGSWTGPIRLGAAYHFDPPRQQALNVAACGWNNMHRWCKCGRSCDGL